MFGSYNIPKATVATAQTPVVFVPKQSPATPGKDPSIPDYSNVSYDDLKTYDKDALDNYITYQGIRASR